MRSPILPLQVDVVPRKDIFHQVDSLVVYLRPHFLGKVQLGSQEVSHRPKPLLRRKQDPTRRQHGLQREASESITQETVGRSNKDTHGSLMIVEAPGQLLVVVIKTVVVDSAVHHVTVGG